MLFMPRVRLSVYFLAHVFKCTLQFCGRERKLSAVSGLYELRIGVGEIKGWGC